MKPVLQNSLSYCVKEQKPCIGWADKYFKDCLCNVKDELSFGFGLVSLVCWGVAEIPQIITNFRTKSGHGISLLFLLTWIAGDIFNLVGCLLEPATLPTQFYTAVEHGSESVYGQWLGWMMAAIYMGGRLPQIWLNIRRGNVEGLNPLMFIFALAANATYVASILVRSTAWDKIKANMPWLLDAMGCVLLDLFVLSQGKSRQQTRI
ncbi:UNVERIFIED_CONTAM: Seven transmembrane protein 1 [Sesamum indicum]